MGIKILVCWENEDEIDKALKLRNQIDKLLDSKNLHAGFRTVNDPPKSFGILVPDKPKTGQVVSLK